MVRHARVRFVLPDEKSWREIKRSCKLNDEQLAVLRAVLDEVADACRVLKDDQHNADIKKGLETADRLLANLEAGLKRQDVMTALRSIETFGNMGVLLSATAASHLLHESDEEEIPLEVLERFIARKRSISEAAKPSELEDLFLTTRQRKLAGMTPEAMLFAAQRMRLPITSWLQLVPRDGGVPSAQVDREFLIYMLARQAREIIGETATSTAKGKFHNLCTWVLNNCGVSTTGLEAAISRCLKKHSPKLAWHGQPGYVSPVGDLTDEQLDAIPEDPEQTP